MERYRRVLRDPGMLPDPNGQWVKHSDHLKHLEGLAEEFEGWAATQQAISDAGSDLGGVLLLRDAYESCAQKIRADIEGER